ncbi:hypothetical protein CFC21_014438 [Triticum aestivum]|uniref:Uncharacterized protein n=2 Tax=Triticum aestivum TaxID=4565 RepID=A0A3B6APU3_WHEAT|nr:hypothetical protein CFC21_014438 [Triticum aestivum]
MVRSGARASQRVLSTSLDSSSSVGVVDGRFLAEDLGADEARRRRQARQDICRGKRPVDSLSVGRNFRPVLEERIDPCLVAVRAASDVEVLYRPYFTAGWLSGSSRTYLVMSSPHASTLSLSPGISILMDDELSSTNDVGFHRPDAEKCFMGAIQLATRSCVPLHRNYIVTPCSPSNALPSPHVLAALIARFTRHYKLSFHDVTDNRIVMTCTHHTTGNRVYNLSRSHSTIIIQGVRYRFMVDDALLHLGRISTNQYIIISMRNLPLHLWKSIIVEQILSPYCSLDYVTQDSLLIEYPSTFTCYAWASPSIMVPPTIQVNVSDEDAYTADQQMIFFSAYNVNLFISEYRIGAHPVKQPYCPTVPITSSGSKPIQCFISQRFIDPA